MTDDVKEKLRQYCDFSGSNVYVLTGMARKKDNPLTKSEEVVIREVLRKDQDIDRRYPRLRKQITDFKDDNHFLNFYLYVSCNARDSQKAFYNFMRRITSWVRDQHFGNKSVQDKVQKVDRYWISELQKPENKAESKFLWDVDVDEDIEILEQMTNTFPTTVRQRVPTRNGYHIVTDPFDYNEIQTPDCVELKKDGMLFLDYINNRGDRD